jgi:hypothetical protein
MKKIEKETKDHRITIRFTKSELDAMDAKIADAGYKTSGAFIRDFVASAKPRAKISGDVVQIARELMSLAFMINSNAPAPELLKKVKHISAINTGGVK